jgi:hypothetical protein
MRPIVVQLSAVGVSPWIPLDYLARTFNVGLLGDVSSGATLTYSVEMTLDNPNLTPKQKLANQVASLVRSGTVASVVMSNAHNLSVGDSSVITNSGDPNLDGSQTVASVVSPTSFTYTVANTGALVGSVYTQAALLRVQPVPIAALVGAVARFLGDLVTPCMAVRLHVTAYTGGVATLEVIQGYGRG